MNKKKKILYILSTFNDQGYVSTRWSLCKLIDKNKYQFSVCCMREGGPYEERFKALGIQVKNLEMKNVLDVRGLFKLTRFIRKNNIDIVHTSIRLADWYGRIAAKLAGVPVIFSTIHNPDYWRRERKYFLYSTIDRLTMTFNTHIIAVSQAVKDFLVRSQKINPDKITVIYNGRDVKKYADLTGFEELRNLFNLRDDIPTIGVTARLTWEKGLDNLLQAAKYILQNGRQVQFMIVGDGPLCGELQDLATKLEIGQHVIFTGFRSDIPNVLGLLDIFVMPSLREGFGLSIVEAMLAGKPVIASNIYGIPEVVLDQETGILVPPGEPKVLADTICALLNSPERCRQMGEKGKQRAIKHFSIDKMVRDHEKLYNSYTGVQ